MKFLHDAAALVSAVVLAAAALKTIWVGVPAALDAIDSDPTAAAGAVVVALAGLVAASWFFKEVEHG